MKKAVLLLAHGAPQRLADIPEYLRRVRGGRPLARGLIQEVQRQYAAIGGGSPLLERTREQAEALETLLGVPVHYGMRNWHPFIGEALGDMRSEGIEGIVAVCLAPQYSEMSVGFYFRHTQEAMRELGFGASIEWTKSFHDHPLLAEAFGEKLHELLPAEMVLFTAHSLPSRILSHKDPYDRQTKATALAVAERTGLNRWEFAYQSRGMTDDEWLGPTVESRLDEYQRRGIRDVVVAPIGFVADHVEILYDVDIHFTEYARQRGMRLRRTESLNSSPTFIAALADIVRARLEAN